jgi:2-polyprenyl-3-methyl-5-hydroxy-6-metoxy-1,4-benzoquinol methylase
MSCHTISVDSHSLNTAPVDQLNYEAKATEYFENLRPEMLPFVPARCRRVLDVGCGCGCFGESLKRTRNVEVWGVEPVKAAAAKAAGKLDQVIEGFFDPEAALPVRTFDCVIFNDVLEHMLAPEKALRYARVLLASGGVVVASIPNIRSFPTVWQLMFHARWKYQDCGVLDRTHLRFFTKSSIVDLFQGEGYLLETICGLNAYLGVPNVSNRLWKAYKVATALSLGKFDDMRFLQFAVVARPVPLPIRGAKPPE